MIKRSRTTTIAPKPEAKTVVRRTRSAPATQAPAEVAEELAQAATTVRRTRPAAKPSAPLTEALQLIATTEIDPKAPRTKDVIDMYDRIISDYKAKANTPKRAIRAMCIECMGGMQAEVARCTSDDCALFPFRMGKNPFHKLAKNNREEDDEQTTNDRPTRTPASGEGHTGKPVRRARRVS